MPSRNEIMKTLYISVGCVVLILGMFAPDVRGKIKARNGGALTKFLFLLPFVVYSFDIILWLIDLVKSKLNAIKVKKERQPFDEMIDFIIEHNGLPVTKAREKFGRTGEKCKEIGDRLEQWGILTRGKDNARVLAEQDPQVIEFGLDTEHYPTEGELYS